MACREIGGTKTPPPRLAARRVTVPQAEGTSCGGETGERRLLWRRGIGVPPLRAPGSWEELAAGDGSRCSRTQPRGRATKEALSNACAQRMQNYACASFVQPQTSLIPEHEPARLQTYAHAKYDRHLKHELRIELNLQVQLVACHTTQHSSHARAHEDDLQGSQAAT
jgi:hypothetical protein